MAEFIAGQRKRRPTTGHEVSVICTVSETSIIAMHLEHAKATGCLSSYVEHPVKKSYLCSSGCRNRYEAKNRVWGLVFEI